MRRTTTKLLIVVTLITCHYCQLPEMNDNTIAMGLNSDTSATEVANANPNTLKRCTDSAIQEQNEDIPKIDNQFKIFCKEILKVKIKQDCLNSDLNNFKENICMKISINTGSQIKNYNLAIAMINYFVEGFISEEFIFTSDSTSAINKAAEINSRINDKLIEQKEKCWETPEECQLSEALKSTKYAGNTLNTLWEDSCVIVDAARLAASGSQRRILSLRRKNRSSFFKSWLEKFREREQKMKLNVEITMMNINMIIKNYRSYDEKKQSEIFKGIYLDLNPARKRCENKFGAGNCQRMPGVPAYCATCPPQAKTYWKTVSTCGCQIIKSRGSYRLLSGNRIDYSSFSYSRKEAYNPKDYRTYGYNYQRYSFNWYAVDDAFFYEVEDHYNK